VLFYFISECTKVLCCPDPLASLREWGSEEGEGMGRAGVEGKRIVRRGRRGEGKTCGD